MSLRWKLTLSYTLVTAGAILLVELVVLLAAVYLLASPRTLARVVVPVLSDAATELAPALAQQPPDLEAVRPWLADLVRTGRLASQDAAPARLNLDPLYLRGALLVGPDGRVWVAEPRDLCPEDRPAAECLPPAAWDVVQRALHGEQRSERLYTGDPTHGNWMAAPVRDERGRILAALVLYVTLPHGLGEWLRLLAEPLLPSALAVLAFAAVIGTVFGYFTARGLTRRLTALAQAADAWSRGDFRASVHDPARDELGQLARRLNRMAEQLHNLLQARQELAALEERNRLARELHDAVKQQIFAAGMQIAAARQHLAQQPRQAQAALEQAEDLIQQAQQELTALIRELRPAALAGRGLVPALREYLAQWEAQTGITADLQVQGQRPLPLEVEQALFRVAQEALSNAARHSGARKVVVRLTWTPAAVTLEVRDDGQGFDPTRARQGLGLHSMAERVQALGGTLQVDSAPGAGTRVVASVPV